MKKAKPSLKKNLAGPLQGIRVLDLTRLYPGPLGAMLMAQMGAEVIKVEDPAYPDPMRNYAPFHGDMPAGFLALNRGKRGLALKLGSVEGIAVFRELCRHADVVLEGFRPGFAARLGLDYQTLSAVNPGLVYLSITGYGQDGPYAAAAGHDLNYVGYSGILDGFARGASGPDLPGIQLADVAGGAYMAVIGALAALLARQTTGKGQHVDLAMLDGVLPLLTLQLAHRSAFGDHFDKRVHPLSGGSACYGIYPCADGGFLALGALEPKFWNNFCDWIGRPDWVARQFATGDEKKKLEAEIAGVFAQRTRDEWVALAQDTELCLTPVLRPDELARDPQLRHRKMVLETGNRGETVLGAPLKFSGTAAVEPDGSAPKLGQDTRHVLAEVLKYPEEKIREILKKGVAVQC